MYQNYSHYGAYAITDDITDRLELSDKQKSLIEKCMNLATFKIDKKLISLELKNNLVKTSY